MDDDNKEVTANRFLKDSILKSLAIQVHYLAAQNFYLKLLVLAAVLGNCGLAWSIPTLSFLSIPLIIILLVIVVSIDFYIRRITHTEKG